MSEQLFTAGGHGAAGRVILIPDEHILYDAPILERTPEGVPADFAITWRDNTLAQVDTKLVPGWAALLASEDTFLSRLASPAAAGYTDFLKPGATTRKGRSTEAATLRHARRLAQSYTKMVDAIEFMTTLGLDEYRDRLRRSMPDYRREEAVPLSLTGSYVENLLGAAVRSWFFLALSPKFDLYKWLTDYTEGNFPPDVPFLIDGWKWDIARRHNNLCIQGGCFVLQRINMQKVHDDLDELLTSALREEWAPPPESTIRFEVVEGVLCIRTLLALSDQ